MANSILEAIKIGIWNFEPLERNEDEFHPTEALPGTKEKLDVLTERVQRGLPLWHPSDRLDCSYLEKLEGAARMEVC